MRRVGCMLAFAAVILAAGWASAKPPAGKGSSQSPAQKAQNPPPPPADQQDPLAVVEHLLQTAEKNQLSGEQAAQAAALLDHEDPFVRGVAEWAIATKVGQDNNGQQVRWPCANPPAWFVQWSALPPEFLLESDYVRQAFGWGLHRDAEALRGSVEKILQRARGVAAEVEATALPVEKKATVARQLAELTAIRDRLAARLREAPQEMAGPRRLWLLARNAARPVALANPAVDFERLVFVSLHAAHSHRNITGSQYPWIHKPGGDICVKTGLDPGGPVRGVLQGQLGPGHVHGIDLHWDAEKVVFGYARQPSWPPRWDTLGGDHSFELRTDQEPTHLYEIGPDGRGLRQLTDHRHWSDFEPTYTAAGDVVFASDRSGRSSECGKFSADHTVINLYRMTGDGKNLRRLSDNKDIDRYPHSLDNGLIAYTRWEYQERHFLELHAIWSIRPEGTMADAVFKQHLNAPYGLRDARSVPGGSKLVAIATGHHTFAYGPVVVIDPTRGINAPRAMQIVTPHVKPEEGPMAGVPGSEGGVPDRGGLYHGPWALSDRCFLVSYSYARVPSTTSGGRNATGFALYLIDVYGNKELIHRDPILSCMFPMPLKKRPRPPVVPFVTVPSAEDCATCYLSDVYQGLSGIDRGSVKYLRISQRVGWPLDAGTGAKRYIPGNAWEKHFGYWEWAPVRVLGEVPVEADGSACFMVPADTSVYFQALDERHMELRRMRSHVSLQPGESRGCRGCHESQARTPAAESRSPLALRRPPQMPVPPPWGAQRLLGYPWLVQPILDRHCTRCHGREKPDGGLDFTGAEADDGFAQSFRTIFGLLPGQSKPGRPLVAVSNRFSNADISQPKQFGSLRSPLVTVLLGDELHKKEVRLSEAEWLSLVTWVDANAPYHDTFFNKRPNHGGPPRRDFVLQR